MIGPGCLASRAGSKCLRVVLERGIVTRMCGICGCFLADPRKVEPAVRRMMRSLVHRGPDDEGYWSSALDGGTTADASVGFGFRRLAIRDLTSAGHQPMVHPETGDCLVFNGEIYNFRELRAELLDRGEVIRSSGDTEVLLRALSRWGEPVLERLDGMYAFAFFQASRRRVLLARDHAGIKPLYVARKPRSIVFASEVRAVLASGLVSDELDPGGVASQLAYGSPQDPLTVHSEIESFPAASCRWIDARSVANDRAVPTRRYWRFPSSLAGIACRDAPDAIGCRLEAAVHSQLVADVPVSVFLSGGIDSALVAAIARRAVPSLTTHAVGFESGSDADESTAAATTASLLGTVHRQTIVDGPQAAVEWQSWLAAADRPSIDGLNSFIVSRAVKASGATVALSGLGADELFGGYPQFRSGPALQRWLAPLALMPRFARRAAARVAFAALRPTRRERAVDLVTHCQSPFDTLLVLRRVFRDADLAALGLRSQRIGLTDAFLPPAVEAGLRAESTPDTFHWISQAEFQLYLGNTVLRDVDSNSMAHSLEVRVPFLARDMVEFAARLPGAAHLPAGGRAKRLLLDLGADYLPPEVLARPKRGFSLPIGEWMRGPLRDASEAAVDAVAACPLFESAAVQSMWARLRSLGPAVFWDRALALVVLGNYLTRMARPEAAGGGS